MSTAAMASAIVVIGLLTYASRAGFILFFADRPLPPPVVKALRNVGPAVLSALTVSIVAGGQGVSGIAGEEIAGLAVGGAVAAWSRNLIVSLLAGMCAVWAVAALV